MNKAIAAAKQTAEEQTRARAMVAKRNTERRETELEEKEKRTQMRSAGRQVAARNPPPPLATENLLKNTDGVLHQCSLGATACYLLFTLTCAVLMTSSSVHQASGSDCSSKANVRFDAPLYGG